VVAAALTSDMWSTKTASGTARGNISSRSSANLIAGKTHVRGAACGTSLLPVASLGRREREVFAEKKVGAGGVLQEGRLETAGRENLRGGEGGRSDGRRTGPERESAGRKRDISTHLDSSLGSIVGCMGCIVGDIKSSLSSPG